MKIRLIGGLAHEFSATVPDNAPEIFVTMITGRPQIVVDVNAPEAQELLANAHGTFEPYARVQGLIPDSQGRYGYYVMSPLPPRLSDLPAPSRTGKHINDSRR